MSDSLCLLGVGGGFIAADNFSQTPGTDLSTTGWTLYEGDYQTVAGGGAQCVSQSGHAFAAAVRDCGHANIVLNEQIEQLSAATGTNGAGLAFRWTWDAINGANGWRVAVARGGTLVIAKLVNDVQTVVASAIITLTPNTTYSLQASANGTTINASFNNTTTLQYTSATTNLAVTRHGICDANQANGFLHTNWSAWL